VHDDHKRRNFSKIRFYGEIFAVNFSRAARAEKFMLRLPKQSSSREKIAQAIFEQGWRRCGNLKGGVNEHGECCGCCKEERE